MENCPKCNKDSVSENTLVKERLFRYTPVTGSRRITLKAPKFKYVCLNCFHEFNENKKGKESLWKIAK